MLFTMLRSFEWKASTASASVAISCVAEAANESVTKVRIQ